MPADGVEQLGVPGIVVAADHQFGAWVYMAQHGGIAAILNSIAGGIEVPAATPVLVAYPPQPDAEWPRRTIGSAQLPQCRRQRCIAILEPVAQLLRRAAADIARQVRLGADLGAEIQELVGTQTVIVLNL